jgi:outer membrane protein assembly factor BamE (lipoprotein component of BamABCDE complex)
MKNFVTIMTAGLVLAVATGCTPASQHRKEVTDDSTDRVTVGTVQKDIKIGMSSAEVIAVLGSPNILSTDSESREVWVYDKISTERVVSSSGGGVSLFGAIIGSSAGVLPGANYGSSSGASSQSQRTLTIIIKFDKDSKVRDVSYHTSRF